MFKEKIGMQLKKVVERLLKHWDDSEEKMKK